MNKISPIITARWLAENIFSHKNLRVLDGTWHMPNTNRNAKLEYASEHITTALFFDIDECADQTTDLSHMLPETSDFEKYVGKLGINNDTHVVVYDNHDVFPLFSAQRVWWTFRTFGHSKVSVLEGGFRRWCSENYPVTDEIIQVPTERFKASLKPNLVKSFEDIEDNLTSKAFQLCDARPRGRFLGTAPEPRAGIKPGHIPGSKNIPFTELFDLDNQTLKSEKELREIFKENGVHLTNPLVCTCGSGISACLLALATYVCGKRDTAIYDGSWTEWYLRAKPGQKVNVPLL